MHIKYRDCSGVYSSVTFDKNRNSFKISGEHLDLLEYNPVLMLDNEYDPQNFSYRLLSNESDWCSENSIYQVFAGKQRIGWIFPIQSLLSEEHDQANNQYFLKYAYVASYLLLQDISEEDKREIPEQIYLDDYYDSKKIILVIDEENTSKLESFSLEDYFVALYQYGYSCNGRGNIFAEPHLIEEKTKITLKKLSSDLSMVPNINFIFKEQLPVAENEIIRFYLYYQIIELLIAIIFEHMFKKLVDKISDDPETLFDQRDNLSKIAGEKHRIKVLFSSYASCLTPHQTDLDLACQKLLHENGKNISDQYYENLYSVRCLLVHRLYSLSHDSYKLLQDINRAFQNVVMDILFSFKKPN